MASGEVTSSDCRYDLKNEALECFITLPLACSLRLLKSSEEAPKVVSSGGLFGRGSKFRYSGHCLSEVYKSSASIDRPQPKFTRYSSRSRPGSASAARSTTLPFSWKSINSSSKNGDKYEREGDSSAASLSTGTTVASSVVTSVQQQPKKCTSDSALVTADGKWNNQQPSLKPLQNYKHQQNDDDHVPLLIAGDVECDFNAPYRSTDGHEVINTCEIINISDDDDDESDSDDDEILNTFNSNGKMNKNEILEINKKIETLFLNGEKLDNKMILNPNFVEYDETVMNLRTNSQYNKTSEFLENNTSTAAANPCSSIAPPPKQSHSISVHPGYVIDSLPSSLPATAPQNAPTPCTTSSTASASFTLSDPPIITLTTTFVNIATPSQKIDSFAKNHQPFVSLSSSSFLSSQPTTYFSAATTVTSFRETPLNHGRIEESWVTESRGTRSLDGWIVEEGEKRMKYTDNSYDTGYTSSGSETVNDNEGDGEDACVKQLEGSSEKLEKPESKSGIRRSLLNLLSFVSSLNKAVEGKHGDERDARDGAEQAGQSGAENQSKIIVSDDGDITPINPIDIVDSFSKANIVIPATASQIHPSIASIESSSSTLSVTQNLLKPLSTSKTQHVVTLTTSLSSPASYNQHVSSLSPPSPISSLSWKGLAAPTTPDDNIQHSHLPSTEETQHAHPYQTSLYSSSSYSSPSYSSPSYSSSSYSSSSYFSSSYSSSSYSSSSYFSPSYSSSPSFDNPSAENYERIKEIRKLLQENKDRIQEIRNTIDNEIKKPLSCYSVSSDSIDITKQIWSEYVVTSSNSTTNKLSSPTLNNHYHNQLSRDGKEAEAVEHHSSVGGGGKVDPTVTSAYPIPISFINNQFEWCGEGGENSGGVGVIINNCIYPDVHHLANVGVCSEYVPDDVDAATDLHEQNYPDESDNKLTCGGFVGAIPNVASDVPVDGATVNAGPKVNDNASNETDLVFPKIDQFLTSLLLPVSSSLSSPAAASPTISSMHGQPLQNSHFPSNRPSPGQQLQEPPPILSDSQLLESTFALLHENDSSHAEQEGCESTTFGEHADAHIADTSIEQHVGEVAVANRANNSKGTMHYLGKGVCLTVASVLLSLILFSIFVIIVFECFQEERYINDYIIIREFKSSVYDLIKQYMTEMFYRHVFRFW
ncbi:hypothetical protein HELRODRAFT_182515 [Helobdella robusta]|uniref:FERM adjacent domain-containing protein n=1 Tax=Helobdella robusta TaxID=6412 RepID=T1FIB0_HELRO|nr:hypothetical protein HELRODRAFT_182515 [Helobdella robusta]ESN90923.1 hypothetical protein HELRODRAFT_182515 [Helobdella robusta]